MRACAELVEPRQVPNSTLVHSRTVMIETLHLPSKLSISGWTVGSRRLPGLHLWRLVLVQQRSLPRRQQTMHSHKGISPSSPSFTDSNKSSRHHSFSVGRSLFASNVSHVSCSSCCSMVAVCDGGIVRARCAMRRNVVGSNPDIACRAGRPVHGLKI